MSSKLCFPCSPSKCFYCSAKHISHIFLHYSIFPFVNSFCRLGICSKLFFTLPVPFVFTTRSKDIYPYNGWHCCFLIFEWILKWIEYTMHPINGIECTYMQFVSICSHNKQHCWKYFRFCFESIVSFDVPSNGANVVHFKCWTILSFVEMIIFLRVSWARSTFASI